MQGFFGGGGLPAGFEEAFGGGGGRGGGGRSREPVDTEQYYKDLGIAKGASSGEIKKAYRKLAVKHHPDKGGDPELFKTITEAFEVLSNDEKRELYDQGGKEAVEQGGMQSSDPFSAMFGGGGRRRAAAGERKGKSVTHKLKVSLEQVYKGEVRKLRLGRVIIDKDKGVRKCSECGGSGMVVKMIRRGPMIQQMQAQCNSCNGGYICDRRNTKEILEVHVPRGAPNGHKLTFYEKGDEIPDGIAGDVIIILEVPEEVKGPEHFKRKGCDLYLFRKIALVEALCGFRCACKATLT